MRLSEAIRLGAAMKPQHFGTGDQGNGSCAVVAAAEAVGLKRGWDYWNLPENFRQTLESITVCPACSSNCESSVVVHLNDFHHWTRERIADFVELHEPPESSGLLVSEPDAIPAGAQK